jgi:hypothetical protein
MHSPRHHHLSSHSSYAQIKPSANGGQTTLNTILYKKARLSLSSRPCKDIPNCLTYGKNMQTKFCATSVSRLRYTNPAYIPERSMANVSSLCDRLTILLLPRLILALPTLLWTSLTRNRPSPSRGKAISTYNSIDIIQTQFYIKINVKLFIKKAFKKHIATWMKTSYPTPNRSTPLPSDGDWLKKFNLASGNPDKASQAQLSKRMQLSYRSGVGKLIWAMTTCQPNLSYTSVKLSQSNTCPHELHYNGLKHALKFLHQSCNDGLYFWRTIPRPELPVGPSPAINSNRNDILLENQPTFDALIAHAYADSVWATCPKTRRSFGGICIPLAGGTIAYKCRFQPTVAGSSTEAEFMAACDTGKMILFIRSVLWDLHVPQEVATLL